MPNRHPTCESARTTRSKLQRIRRSVRELGAWLDASHEVIAEQLEIRQRLERELAEARAALELGNGTYQVALADQAKARAVLRKIATISDDGLPEYTPQAMVSMAQAYLDGRD